MKGREAALLGLVSAVFLAVNLATASRYPATWVDEIQFADPAVNLVLVNGFTSTVWVKQGAHEFWAGNAPLYTGILSVWLRAAGVSPVGVRSLNDVLMVAFAFLVWVFLSRTAIVRSTGGRLAVTVLLMTGHGMMFSFRTGRYDVVGMVLFAAGALAWTVPGTAGLAALVAAGLLVPAAGLQLVPAAALVCLLLVLFGGRPALVRALAAGLGVVLGGAGLWAFFASHGVWGAFRASTSSVGVIGENLLQKVAQVPAILVADKSLVLVALVALVLAVRARSELARTFRTSPLAFGLAVTAVVPAALQVAAKFPIYYAWMAFVPLVVGVVAALERVGLPGPVRAGAAAALVLAALIGLPLRLATVAALWEARDPAPIGAYVAELVRPDDAVVTDFKAYYPVKLRALRTYAPTYVGIMSGTERSGVTALLLSPGSLAPVSAAVGGTWEPAGPALPAGKVDPLPVFRVLNEFRTENYDLRLYRRKP